jgi:predicted RNA-binding protein
MCLLKVYMDRRNGQNLVAEEVAFVTREGNKLKLQRLESRDHVVLEDVYVSLIDTLNSVMVLKPKTENGDNV